MKYYIISHDRPEAPRVMQQALEGIEVTWLLGNDDAGAYRRNGAKNIYSGLSLLEARNFALEDAFHRGESCMEINDDIYNNQIYICKQNHFDRSKYGISHPVMKTLTPATIKDIGDELLKTLQQYPSYRLAGISPTTNPMNLRPLVTTTNFIIADLFVCLPTHLRFDKNMSLKEDYDFTLQHMKEHGGVVRCEYIFCYFKHKTPGGVKKIRTQEREQENIRYLKEKWGESVVRDSSTRQGEIRINSKKIV